MGLSSAWLLPFGLLSFVIVFVPLRMLDDQGLPRYRALRSELHHIVEENDRMRRDLQQMEHTVQALRTDPESLERIARDELGMLRQGEILFQFND
jgi:cell division protein FtsB